MFLTLGLLFIPTKPIIFPSLLLLLCCYVLYFVSLYAFLLHLCIFVGFIFGLCTAKPVRK